MAKSKVDKPKPVYEAGTLTREAAFLWYQIAKSAMLADWAKDEPDNDLPKVKVASDGVIVTDQGIIWLGDDSHSVISIKTDRPPKPYHPLDYEDVVKRVKTFIDELTNYHDGDCAVYPAHHHDQPYEMKDCTCHAAKALKVQALLKGGLMGGGQ